MTSACLIGFGLAIAVALLAGWAIGRARARQAANPEAGRFQATFEQAAVGIAHVDPSGVLLRANARYCEIAGHDCAALLHKPLQEITHPDDIALDRELSADLLSGRKDHGSVEKRYLRADGRVAWISETRSIVRDAAGRPDFLISIIEDIRTHKAAEAQVVTGEERLRMLQNEFAHLARVNDLGEMAAAIAHEINQPLTAIVNYLNTALLVTRQGYGEDAFAEAEAMMREASGQALRAGDIVRRLREFVGQGTGDRKAVRLEQLVDSAMALALIDARSGGIAIDRTAEVGDALVAVDTIQIQQVLVNLLRNAVDALGGGDPGRPRRVTISTSSAPEDMVEVAVADNGPGIDPELSDRLFEPFFTTKPDGMGMGLSVCRRLIEAHGGTIEAENTPGGGATFRFRLPRFGSAAVQT